MKELETFYRLRDKNGLNIEFVNSDDKKLILETDLVRFRQIMNNLLSNALKYTSKGFIRFGYEIEKNEIRFYVSDSGIGIDPRHNESIFNHFYKIEAQSNKIYGGTGIGLAICKKLVELLKGRIWLESKPGQGTDFFFTLPYEKKSRETISKEKAGRSNQPVPALDDIFFVIAEDEPTNYEVLVKMLQISEDRHFWGKDGKEVVEYIENTENHDNMVVLMDIKMPVMNGYDAFKMIKKINSKIPIIAVTAFALKHEKKELLEKGFDDYIAKPIKTEKLIKVISKLTGFQNKS